jgi:hypothetical protein
MEVIKLTFLWINACEQKTLSRKACKLFYQDFYAELSSCSAQQKSSTVTTFNYLIGFSVREVNMAEEFSSKV